MSISPSAAVVLGASGKIPLGLVTVIQMLDRIRVRDKVMSVEFFAGCHSITNGPENAKALRTHGPGSILNTFLIRPAVPVNICVGPVSVQHVGVRSRDEAAWVPCSQHRQLDSERARQYLHHTGRTCLITGTEAYHT